MENNKEKALKASNKSLANKNKSVTVTQILINAKINIKK